MTQPPNPSRPAMTEAEREVMVALADACEKATGADRQLDAAIWCTLHGVSFKGETDASGFTFYDARWDGPCRQQRVAYTASLDAAMTLLPSWLHPTIIGHEREVRLLNGIGNRVGGRDIMAWASTLPLALTAAALRARANQGTPA